MSALVLVVILSQKPDSHGDREQRRHNHRDPQRPVERLLLIGDNLVGCFDRRRGRLGSLVILLVAFTGSIAALTGVTGS